MSGHSDEDDDFPWTGPRWREVDEDEDPGPRRRVPPTPPHRPLGAIDRGSTTGDEGPEDPPPVAPPADSDA